MTTTIVFVGAGFSNTSLLVNLVEKIQTNPQSKTAAHLKLKFLLIDQNGDFGTGTPYGKNASDVFLLNDNVKTTDVFGFRDWLVNKKHVWLSKVQESTDVRVLRWLKHNQRSIEQNAFDDLFLPRSVFGLFMKAMLQKTVELAEQAAISVDFVHDTVIGIEQNDRRDSYHVWVSSKPTPIQAQIVVLGVGVLPQNKLTTTVETLRYIQNIYHKPLSVVEEQIYTLLKQSDEKRLVILGSSATAYEMLYCLFGKPSLSEVLNEVLIISKSGTLPCSRKSTEPCTYTFTSAQRLLSSDAVNAHELFEAFQNDLSLAQKQGWTIHDIVASIRLYFPPLFEGLSLTEKELFVRKYGRKFMFITRRTAVDYGNIVKLAFESGKVQLITGEVLEVKEATNKLLITLNVEGREQILSADMVIDCMGAPDMNHSDSALMKSLIKNELIRINHSGMGIDVNLEFEAAPNFYVFGPLLAGLSNIYYHIWQLESLPQLYKYSSMIANNIFHRLSLASA